MSATAPNVEVMTFGCRLNSVDSEELARDHQGDGETVIINTCAVTAEATRQARRSASCAASVRRPKSSLLAARRVLIPTPSQRSTE
jgi:tRNA A37 methylthiotransferase MiaB